MIKKVLQLIIFSTSVLFSQTFWERTEPYMYGLTAFRFVGGDTVYGTLSSGFARSTNNGTTWTTPALVNYVQDIAVAPNGNIFLAQNQQKISRSTNKGNSWTITGTGITETSCSSVLVTANGTVLAGTASGIYRSTNNGDGWTKVAGKIELGSDTSISTFTSRDGKTLFAFSRVYNSIYKGFALRSTNDGVTWTKGMNSLDTTSIFRAVLHQNGTIYVRTNNGLRSSTDGGNTWSTTGFYGKYIGDVAIDSNGIIYVTVSDNSSGVQNVLFKSTNTGANWTPISTPTLGVTGIAINKNGHLFLSQDQTYRSTDGGSTWKGLPVLYPEVKYMQESPTHELFITAGGSAYQNLYRSSDFGQTWRFVNAGVVGIPIVGFYGDTIFVGDNYYLGTVFRSIDNGITFNALPNNNGLNGYVNTILGTTKQTVIAGTSNGIYQSKNHGNAWVKTSNSSASFLKQSSNGAIFALREVINDGIYRSNDSGSTWQLKITGMSNVIARGFVIAPNGNLFCGTDGGIFRSTNDGDAWVRIDTQKTTKPIGQYVAVNRDGKLFVGGTPSGSTNSVYQSTDNGVSWTLLPDDIFTIDSQTKVRQLFVSSNGSLFAGSTIGLFRSKNVTTGIQREVEDREIPASFTLGQNYPNPFNPNTIIRFSVNNSGATTLIVYDVLGKEIRTLINEALTAGSYETTFNAAGLSSGIYFYRLSNGTSTEIKRMMLLK